MSAARRLISAYCGRGNFLAQVKWIFSWKQQARVASFSADFSSYAFFYSFPNGGFSMQDPVLPIFCGTPTPLYVFM